MHVLPGPATVDPAMLAGLARGVLLGLGAAMPIGPINVQIARNVFRAGMLAGVAVGCGAVTVDVTYALLSTFSFVRVVNRPEVLLPIAAVGVLLLGYLGVQCLKAARAAWKTDPLAADSATGAGAKSSTARGYLTGLLMTLLNPMTLVFWFSVVPAMGAARGQQGSPTQAADDNLPMMCAGVFIGTLAWVLFFSTLLAWASKHASRRPERRRKWLAAADVFGGLTLLGFAVVGFLRLVGALL